MAYTGGELNELNGKMGISAPFKSVPVMKLIKIHNPKSKEELAEQIKWHANNICECGIKSKGTVESFGRNLFDSQIKYWGVEKYSLKECIQWEYDLFIVQSLKGGTIEKIAINSFNEQLPSLIFEEAKGFIDEELRIDVVIKKDNKEIAGIQIKPSTFKLMRKEIIAFNVKANKLWNNPVFYLYYDKSENFENFSEILDILKKQFLNT